MVEDPNLAIHLAHFGINLKNLQKTEKTMAELEIDLNQKLGEWDVIQEAGSNLRAIYGSGFTGMRNLGNSCYMNSIMQLIFTIPDFKRKYFSDYLNIFKKAAADPSQDLNFQMTKLAFGLLSGKYSVEPNKNLEEFNKLSVPKGIKPHSFKHLIGKNHAEFSTKRQQDAFEFFEHLVSSIDRNHQQERNANPQAINPTDCFKFEIEDRIECLQTNRVRYVKRVENSLSVSVALEMTQNKEEVEKYEKYKNECESKGEKLDPSLLCRPRVSLLDCIQLLASNELITDFYNNQTKKHGNALKSISFSTFPDLLLIQMRKFTLAKDWTPLKLDVEIDAPDVIDMNKYKGGYGLKQGEDELKTEDSANAKHETATEVKLNENIVAQLMDMGFSLEGSKRAAYNTRELNDFEAAVNWAVSHMEDADFNSQFEIPKAQQKPSSVQSSNSFKANEESIQFIMSMGFSRQQATKALKETNNNLERAADWIFSHTDELMNVDEGENVAENVAGASASSSQVTNNLRNGNGTYELVGFVSHMGTNANVGHYVVHLKKENKWYIYNDQNVFESEKAHRELAYLYLYRRI